MKKEQLKKIIKEVISESNNSWRWTGTIGKPKENIYLFQGDICVLCCDGVDDRWAKYILNALKSYKGN